MSSPNISLISTIFSIQQQIARYVYPIYLIFGVTGCCLNILLLIRRQFRTVSCCIYFMAASVAMLINLSMGTGAAIYALNHVDPNLTILAFCKMRIYILQSSSMMYRWCLAVACFDRVAISSNDVRLRNFAKVHIACRFIFIIVIIWLILPVHLLIFYNLYGGGCGILFSFTIALYHSIFTTVAGGVLPVMIMIVCTLFIHHNLGLKRERREKNNGQTLENRNIKQNLQRKRDRQVLLMLFVQVAVYSILIAPLMVVYFYNAVTLNIGNKSPERLAIERLAQFVGESLIYLFSVLSFYIYTMVSRSYRGELIKILRSIMTCKWYCSNHRIEPIINDTPQRQITPTT
ncbi:unnamed protein product [Adineta steineri]|uniref:G-protein coupled receptors family 1 profile domain-containing protein n=1 Tax=Adineta steineri TaxID=433720 RepID=A0A815VW78_9BILA|nr:unnamed protein product [Adineta steineri]CAF1533254.1 unnamed protein product [Adineta steineri]